MIQTVIFDLDGTLVQTEELKAESYARAAVELSADSLTEAEVIARFKDVVGMSRSEIAMILVERFHLAEKARARMAEFGVNTPWEAYGQLRLRYYDSMLDDQALIRAHEIPHNISLLHDMRARGFKTGLATMSYRDQVEQILNILDWHSKFDFTAARDDVERGKPDPEIYRLVARYLEAAPENCLVIEDSPIGVQAALAAGMKVIAVSTPLTHDGLHEMKALDARWLVDDPTTLMDVVKQGLAGK